MRFSSSGVLFKRTLTNPISTQQKVLEVGEAFSNDLRGGTGYVDAMRSYT